MGQKKISNLHIVTDIKVLVISLIYIINMARVTVLLLLAYLVTLVSNIHSISFSLSAQSKKCLKEEVHKNVLVTGEYLVSEAKIKTHLTVTDTNGHVLYKKNDAKKGKFAFTTDQY